MTNQIHCKACNSSKFKRTHLETDIIEILEEDGNLSDQEPSGFITDMYSYRCQKCNRRISKYDDKEIVKVPTTKEID